MPVFNVGSINVDNFYYLNALPQPGETLAAEQFKRGLGGKGANQSVAAALAGSKTHHIGAVGEDGLWARDRLVHRGVGVANIVISPEPTGHAIINVDATGENSIVLYAGANHQISEHQVETALSTSGPKDILLLQNETNASSMAARMAHKAGIRVIYSAAPFDAAAVSELLGSIDLLLMNEVEAAQLMSALGRNLSDLGIPEIIVTKGAGGSDLHRGAQVTHVPARAAKAVDTTGAGDCFAGYVAALLDQGADTEEAMKIASAASAIKVTRRGTSDVFPDRQEVDAFLAKNA